MKTGEWLLEKNWKERKRKKNPRSPETPISKSLEEANLTAKYKLAKLMYSTRMSENRDTTRIQWICRAGMRKMRRKKAKAKKQTSKQHKS